ncbi:tRNA (adenosine(37)-N6)-threonylcarbamoyltransferase complex ATPase subunit type 1 TsaE [[Limnothrix rosea] IAM M-220]|uniref:tRNA (adenosine(37)-N6)-threonylcarbamoyltransferase complex ATPase subunit type 1 TsaE n=1 Tax=[Limnothrix rosea] IAM M-220 TaxID=454133 RepID=UPI00096524C2|nr:tRNA (adenosine(37)-N6)-threonylcarbamoyltransferase complex ATPase subunit type 1 TsaE [[Limnothrix rosea] IAM M-220]OKH14229.1 tRNA (adenosine(37)-N6)-threonylcarbamoyltransferase complex ATPase subunit type 1 TsaE [[Limnothrix rosea] IAM M-220]
MTKSFLLPDTAATLDFGKRLGECLQPYAVLLLKGDLGVGKTTLTQGIGTGLGITEAIASPTFTLVNEYHAGRIPLYHLDLYRLEPEQVDSIYPETYWEGVESEPGITVIEWSERLPFLPESYFEIILSHTDDDQRQAIITATNADLAGLFQ